MVRCPSAAVTNPLLLVFVISSTLLLTGLALATIDIEQYGAGLYLALVSIVIVVVVLAFCLVGTEEQTEPTVAKRVWSTTRQTMRRYAPLRTFSRREPSSNPAASNNLLAPPTGVGLLEVPGQQIQVPDDIISTDSSI